MGEASLDTSDTSILNIKQRRLVLVDTVDEGMLLKVLLAFDLLELHSKTKPIHVVLSTYGGGAYEALGIYDRIKGSPCHITIEAIGPLMSAGTIILQAADRRILNPSTRFMFHYGSTSGGEDEKATDVISRIEFEKKEDAALMEKIYFDRIRKKNKKYKLSDLKKALSSDTYLTPRQTVDLGLADEIKEGEKK